MFAKDPVNTSRQEEIDLAKAVFVVQLAIIHMFVECTTEKGLYFGLPYFFDSITGGPFGAPMTIFAMGIGLNYSRRREPKLLLKRGLITWMIGWLHNICKVVIPSIIGYAVTGDGTRYVIRTFYLAFGNDLLQFAGLAMMVMAGLEALKFTKEKTLIFGIVLLIIGNLTDGADFHQPVVNVIMGHFIGVDVPGELVVSDFPLFFWFSVYALGQIFGYYLMRMTDKDKFYRIVTLPAILITVPALIYEYTHLTSMMGGPGANVFYHPAIYDVVLCMGAVFMTFGIDYFIMKHLSENIKDHIVRISRNITAIYFFQWVLVWWVADLFIVLIKGDPYLNVPTTLIIGVILSILSLQLGDKWMNFYSNRKNGRS